MAAYAKTQCDFIQCNLKRSVIEILLNSIKSSVFYLFFSDKIYKMQNRTLNVFQISNFNRNVRIS